MPRVIILNSVDIHHLKVRKRKKEGRKLLASLKLLTDEI
jgi:hypothetical protein